ncbi:MAG: hypothetical protein WC352_03295 [Candidatus Omnitrophota bacterium]|jgi:hypothetical protein
MVLSRVAGLFLLAFALAGCQAGPAGAPSSPAFADFDDWGAARGILDRLFSDYEHYSRGSFEDLVAGDFVPDRFDYLQSLDTAAYGGKVLQLDYFINRVVNDPDRFAIDFRWNKKWMDSRTGGGPKLLSGQVQMVFKARGSSWVLWQVRGQDPLTAV